MESLPGESSLLLHGRVSSLAAQGSIELDSEEKGWIWLASGAETEGSSLTGSLRISSEMPQRMHLLLVSCALACCWPPSLLKWAQLRRSERS
jgi:hypothetical protein